MPAIDGQIVATGISYDLTVVTRNTKDMEISGAIVHNPWKSTLLAHTRNLQRLF